MQVTKNGEDRYSLPSAPGEGVGSPSVSGAHAGAPGYLTGMQHLPEAHSVFLHQALATLKTDPRVLAVIVSGSAVSGGMDIWSDLDLVVLVEDAVERSFAEEHFEVAGRLGTLLTAFRADHFGEPRLLICLYDEPLLHVDLKFMAFQDAPSLRYAADVVWARGAKPELLGAGSPSRPNLQWFADRLPGWAHYMGTKLGRGELFEAMNSLEFLRSRFLAPLISIESAVTIRGLRRLEEANSPRLSELARTYCTYERSEILRTAELGYALAQSLLDSVGPHLNRHDHAEMRALAYLRESGGRPVGRSLESTKTSVLPAHHKRP